MRKLMRLELSKFGIWNYVGWAMFANVVIFGLICGMCLDSQARLELSLTSYDSVFSIIATLARGTYIVFAAVMLARFVIDEFRNRTITVLFSYPVHRQVLMSAKLLVVVSFTFIADAAGNLLMDAGFYVFNRIEHVVHEPFTAPIETRWLLAILMGALATSFLSLIPLYFGMRKQSVSTTIISSVVLAAIVSQSIGHITLFSVIAIPLILAVIGAAIGYLTIRNVEHLNLSN